MDQFIVATDSGCDLPPELLKENKIAAIMLHYDMNGESFEDNASAEERKEFYEKMRRGTTPKTTQINETRFEEFFRGLKKIVPIFRLYISVSAGRFRVLAETRRKRRKN